MNDFDFVEKTKNMLLKTNLSLPENVSKTLLLNYLLESNPTAKKAAREEIDELVGLTAPKTLFSKKPSFYVPDVQKSEIRIGRVVQGENLFQDYTIGVDDLQHAGIFASTYSGKTTLIVTILTQLSGLQNPIRFLAFDLKRDLRSLSRKYPIRVLRWDWLRINPMQPPPGVPVKQWMTFVSDIMAHVFGWFHASENYLMQFMQRAYDAKTDGYPTFRVLHDLIATSEEVGRRYSEYREVVINRLGSMMIVLGEVLDTETSFPIERLLEEDVVIELDGLRRDEANFLVEFILAYIFAYRMVNDQRGKISHLIVFDEATRFFFKGRLFSETTTELGISFLDTVPQIIRDYKEGLLCAAQEPSLVSHSLMGNLRTKFVGYLSEGEDLEAISRSLDLDDEERQELSKLGERGYWVVKRAGEKPFAVKTDDFPLMKDMNDEELKQRMNGFVEELSQTTKLHVPPQPERTVEPARIITPQISADGWDLLVNVGQHPFYGIRSRIQRLKLSARRIEAAIDELGQMQLVVPVSVPLGRFRPVRFLVPTSEALSLLANVGHDISLWKKIGNVGFEHSLYQVLIAYSFRRRGFETTIEKTLASGRRVDVFIDGKLKIGIEIELTTGNLEEKLRGIDELDRLVLLVKAEQVLQEYQNELSNRHADKVTVSRVIEFLRENSTGNRLGTTGINAFSSEQTDFGSGLE